MLSKLMIELTANKCTYRFTSSVKYSDIQQWASPVYMRLWHDSPGTTPHHIHRRDYKIVFTFGRGSKPLLNYLSHHGRFQTSHDRESPVAFA